MAAIRVLMTGASGFVGSHVAHALRARDLPVRALVRSSSNTETLSRLGVELVHGALDDIESIRNAVRDVDVVLHLAAVTRARTEAEYHRVNEYGTAVLLRAIQEVVEPRPRRLVYLSSLAAVGPSADGRPVAPGDTPRPLTAYGRSKLAGERALAAVEGPEVVIVRAPAVYGPRDREFFRFFRLAALGILPVPTGPARPLQLIHVQDLAHALVLAAMAEERVAGTVHVAEPCAYAWKQVAREVARAVGRPDARVVPVPAAVLRSAAALSEWASAAAGRSTIFNRDKALELLAPGWLTETESARRLLGFQTRIPLPEGLRETARWYRAEAWL